MKLMTFEEYARASKERDIRLIDVREEDEWEEVHVHGTELHPLSKLRAGVYPDPDDRETAIICRSGGRSAMAVQILEGEGWSELTNISDGTIGAINLGDEYVERG